MIRWEGIILYLQRRLGGKPRYIISIVLCLVSRHSTENLVKGGEELKPIYKCYSSVDVSSSKSDAPK